MFSEAATPQQGLSNSGQQSSSKPTDTSGGGDLHRQQEVTPYVRLPSEAPGNGELREGEEENGPSPETPAAGAKPGDEMTVIVTANICF